MTRIVPEVFVYTYVGADAVLAGRFLLRDGVGHFRYAREYLGMPGAYALDPVNMPMQDGELTTSADGGYFGALLDCCAQEWGQRVIHMIGHKLARDERDAVIAAGVSDPHNLLILGSGYGAGSLRFSMVPFVTATELEPNQGDHALDDIDHIRRLACVMARADANQELSDEERAMLVAGMSLGGSRPKALVRHAGHHWIAKFHRARETVDIQRVELAVNHLAADAGITVAPCSAEAYELDGLSRTIFLSRRFDRGAAGEPVHFISACTLLNAPRSVHAGPGGPQNLTNAQANFSYMDIAHMVRQVGAAPREDLEELFRRMAFNVVVGNRDDHLCNHGFLYQPGTGKYRLSPAYDLALAPHQPSFHPIAVGDQGRIGTIENVLSRCGEFGLRKTHALEVVEQVVDAVERWPQTFELCEIAPGDAQWASAMFLADPRARLAEARPASVPSASLEVGL